MCRLNFLFLIVACLFLFSKAQAYIVVKAINVEKNSVIVKLSEPNEVSMDTSLEYKDSQGNSCIVKVKKITNMTALAEATMCDDISIIKPGKMLDVEGFSAFQPPRVSKVDSVEDGDAQSNREKRRVMRDIKVERNSGGRDRSRRGSSLGAKFGLRLHYSTATQMYYGSKSADTDLLEFVIKTPGAVGLGLNFSYIGESSLMIGLGVSYEMERKLLSIETSDKNVIEITDERSIAFAVVDLNLGYVIYNSVNLFVGANMPSPILKNFNEVKVSGFAGHQYGLAYLASSNLSFDLTFRYLNLAVVDEDIKYDQTQLDGAVVGFGYLF
jgi:hypothetical protein